MVIEYRISYRVVQYFHSLLWSFDDFFCDGFFAVFVRAESREIEAPALSYWEGRLICEYVI